MNSKTQNKTKTVLITGATTGIGKAAALHLGRAGHRVIATGRKAELMESLREEASRQGFEIETVSLDVTDNRSIEAAVVSVDRLTNGRGVDVLVNNAGYGQAGPLETLSDAQLRAQFDTNVFGLMAVIRAFVPKMRERGSGRVVNISSVGGRVTFPFLGAYHASKYAVEAMSDALRMELAPFGIKVVVVEPGPIDTEFSERAMSTVRLDGPAAPAYEALIARRDEIRKFSDSMSVGPATVSRAIERAIIARRPSARYVAPFTARSVFLLYRLPVSWVDAILSRFAGLSAKQMRQSRAASSPALSA